MCPTNTQILIQTLDNKVLYLHGFPPRPPPSPPVWCLIDEHEIYVRFHNSIILWIIFIYQFYDIFQYKVFQLIQIKII